MDSKKRFWHQFEQSNYFINRFPAFKSHRTPLKLSKSDARALSILTRFSSFPKFSWRCPKWVYAFLHHPLDYSSFSTIQRWWLCRRETHLNQIYSIISELKLARRLFLNSSCIYMQQCTEWATESDGRSYLPNY